MFPWSSNIKTGSSHKVILFILPCFLSQQFFCGPALAASKDGKLPLNTTAWCPLVTDGGI